MLPFDADRRFHRLVSTYHLHVVDRTKSTICPILEEAAASPEEPISTGDEMKQARSAARLGDEVASLFAVGEPRWMLWSLAEPC